VTPRIRPLPPLVASQIAAGEVVERPASVVKELVENSLDAGATAITVELEQGGVELIRVTDNGGGISPEDLPLALAPHATSKISQTSDLDHIATLGFRGEALASIASVSRLSIRSRVRDADAACILETEGMVDNLPRDAVRPAAGPVGTSVTVRNLFFNTPARRKFLRTPSTEQSRCVDVLTELAMAHPAVAFTARSDGRLALDVPPGQDPVERALDLLGRELKDQLLIVSADEQSDARGVALWGLVGLPAVARATRAAQHVFINGRAVRDRTIQHALAEAYRGILEPGRHPTALLMLDMSPEAVDVNVHPQKAEVRFRDSGLVHSVVYHAVKRALTAADLTPTISMLRPAAGAREILPSGTSLPSALASFDADAHRRAFVDYFKRAAPSVSQSPIGYGEIREAINAVGPAPTPPPFSPPAAAAPAEVSIPAAVPASPVLQVHNSFLVTQDEQGVVIVDQHALHERVMFEALLARVLETDLESQRLLTPVLLDVLPAQASRLDDLGVLLRRIGIEATQSGPRQISIHSFPTFLFDRGVDPAEFVPDLLDKATSAGFAPESEDALRDVLDMMACKAAIKAGDRMSPSELGELLRLREAVERSSNCPHGRPTTVRLTIRELERLFGRS
jgi:DNA mismatch repair protein MutL